jgi:predicted nucleotidyltransferase
MEKELIKRKIRENIDTMPHKEAVLSLALFGSYIHGDAREDSDVDVLIDLDPEAHISLFDLAHMLQYLEDATGKKIDLVPKRSLSKYFRDEVISEAENIYERT